MMGQRCYSCGEYDLESVNTWTPNPEEPGEWLHVGVCSNCDFGCDFPDGLERAAAVLRTYGLGDIHDVDREDGLINCTEFTFILGGNDEDRTVQTVYWEGSYPFAHDKVMGDFASIEEAARYVAWLYRREAFYQERDEALWHEVEEA